MACQSAPAAMIAALDYTYLAFALAWSGLFFVHVPDATTLLGIALAAVAGWFVI